jgi:cell division protein ZapA
MNRIKVNICGKEYTLSTEESGETVRKRAERTERMINEFTAGSNLGVQNAAVLAVLDALTEADKAERSVDNLRSQIKEYVDEAVKARTEADEAERKLERYKKKHDEAVKTTAEAAKSVETGNTVIEALKSETVFYKEQIEKTEKEAQALKEDAAKALASIKEDIKAAADRAKATAEETAKAALETAKAEVRTAREEARRIKDESDKMLEAAKAEAVNEAEKVFEIRKAEAVKLHEEALDGKNTELEAVRGELAETLSAKEALTLEVERLKKIADAKVNESKVSELKQNLESVHKSGVEKQLRKQLAEQKRQCESMRKEIQTLKRENEQYSIKFQERDIELDEFKARYAELEDENLKQTARIAELWAEHKGD